MSRVRDIGHVISYLEESKVAEAISLLRGMMIKAKRRPSPRSAETGQFISKEQAEENPATSIVYGKDDGSI